MIIGIGGCSQSGKSTLARKLQEKLQGAHIFSLDDYAFPDAYLPMIEDRFDWEIPEAYDFDRLIFELSAIQPKDHAYVIVEGILVFYDPRLADLFDRKIFMQIDKETFYRRRENERRWGKEPQWFVTHVWNSFLKYGQPKELNNFHLLNGQLPIEANHVLREITDYS